MHQKTPSDIQRENWLYNDRSKCRQKKEKDDKCAKEVIDKVNREKGVTLNLKKYYFWENMSKFGL